MCLYPFVINKNELFSGASKDKHREYIICYKSLYLRNYRINKYNTKYISPVMNVPYYLNNFNFSNRKGTKVSPTEYYYGEINKGCHVYIYFNRHYRDNETHLLKCKCYKKDYVVHNIYNREAVFTKIFLLNERM